MRAENEPGASEFAVEAVWLAWHGGLIEPGKHTIARINQILFSNHPVDPNEHANIKIKMVFHMGLVSRSVHAAQASLMMALRPPGGLDLGRTPANEKIDRHFAMGNLQQGAREQTIRNILGVFNMLANVLLMPGEPWAQAPLSWIRRTIPASHSLSAMASS